MRATFKGGYTLSFYKADVTTGEAQEIWHNQPKDMIAANIGNPQLAGDFVVFQYTVGGGRGGEAADAAAKAAARSRAAGTPGRPGDAGCAGGRVGSLLLAQHDGFVGSSGIADDDQWPDRKSDIDRASRPMSKTFYYCTNAGDIERRHIWAVPVDGGTPVQITTGDGVETSPAPLASGKYLATLSANWNMPQSVGVWKRRRKVR